MLTAPLPGHGGASDDEGRDQDHHCSDDDERFHRRAY